MRYCRYKGILCEFATEYGHCKVTACVKKRMANITVPIQSQLPDDWVEQIVDRLRNDPESEWVQIVRCKDCKHLQKWRSEESAKKFGQIYECARNVLNCPKSEDFCSCAERREE